MASVQARESGAAAEVGGRTLAAFLQTDRGTAALLLLLWLIPVVLVGVRGEFAESDSWAYSSATKAFLETGRIERLPWTFAPIITNVVVGGLFAKLFGFSFAVLRLSSVVMGGLGMLGVFALGRVFRLSRALSALTAGVFAFGLFHLGLSYTFMTDVTYTTCTTWSLVALCWGIREKRPLGFILGGIAAFAAALSRQTGVVLPVAILLVLPLARIKSARGFVILGSAGASLVVVAYLVERYLLGWSNFGVMRALTVAFLRPGALYAVASHAFPSLILLGLAGLPLLVVIALCRGALRVRHLALGAALGACTLLFVLIKLPHRPFDINLVERAGFGPLILHCAKQGPMMPVVAWWTLVALGAGAAGIGASVFLFWIVEGVWPERQRSPEHLLLVVYFVLYLGPVWLRYPYHNRYLVPITSVWLLMLALTLRKFVLAPRALAIGVATAGLAGLLSVVAVRDYLGHLRAREALLAPLLERGGDPALIEGGLEFDGTYRYHPTPVLPGQSPFAANRWIIERIHTLLASGPGPWPHPDQYLVSRCEKVDGFQPVASERRRHLLTLSEERLYLLQRVGGGPR